MHLCCGSIRIHFDWLHQLLRLNGGCSGAPRSMLLIWNIQIAIAIAIWTLTEPCIVTLVYAATNFNRTQDAYRTRISNKFLRTKSELAGIYYMNHGVHDQIHNDWKRIKNPPQWLYVCSLFFVFFLQTLRDVCAPVPYRRFDSLNTYNRLHNLQADSDLKYGNGTNHSFGDISNVHLQLRSPTDLMPLFLWLFFSLFFLKKKTVPFVFIFLLHKSQSFTLWFAIIKCITNTRNSFILKMDVILKRSAYLS